MKKLVAITEKRVRIDTLSVGDTFCFIDPVSDVTLNHVCTVASKDVFFTDYTTDVGDKYYTCNDTLVAVDEEIYDEAN